MILYKQRNIVQYFVIRRHFFKFLSYFDCYHLWHGPPFSSSQKEGIFNSSIVLPFSNKRYKNFYFCCAHAQLRNEMRFPFLWHMWNNICTRFAKGSSFAKFPYFIKSFMRLWTHDLKWMKTVMSFLCGRLFLIIFFLLVFTESEESALK